MDIVNSTGKASIRRGFLILALCAGAGAFMVGCGKSGSASSAPLPTAPKDVVAAFAKAVDSGDSATVHALATGSDQDFGMMNDFSQFEAANGRAKAALVTKFGDHPDLFNPLDRTVNMMSTHLQAIDIKVNGDSATVVDTNHPDDPNPMMLKQVNGSWKVDLSSADKDPTAAQGAQQMKTSAKNLDGVTADITAGKYATPQQAVTAVTAVLQAYSSSP
jgi:hypothetical protein